MSYIKTQVIGNLGRDPELRYTPQGSAIAEFSIAVKKRKKDKSGDWQDVTLWFKVVTWGKHAENVAKYLSKGSPAFVEGTLDVEEWTDRDGNNRTTLKIEDATVQFIGSKAEREESAQYSGSGQGAAALDTQPDDEISKSAKAGNSATSDDDIPF